MKKNEIKNKPQILSSSKVKWVKRANMFVETTIKDNKFSQRWFNK